MLKRLYVDNYRCLVDFEFIPGDQNVLAGPHGSGRGSLLDVMERIQSLLLHGRQYNTPLSDEFWPEWRTAWQRRDGQTFEVECEVEGESYRYRLEVAHGKDLDDTRLVREELACDGQLLFSFADGVGELHQDDQSFTAPRQWSDQESALGVVLRSTSNERLRNFRTWWRRTLWTANTGIYEWTDEGGTAKRPGPHLSRFAAWYRYAAQTDSEAVARLDKELASALPGFAKLELDQEDGGKLYAVFAGPEEPTTIRIEMEHLAHTERVLINLHAFIHLALKPDRVLWFAAPMASLAATATGGWLKRLLRRAQETSTQVIVAVNQPEALGDLPPGCIRWLERVDGGRTTETSSHRA